MRNDESGDPCPSTLGEYFDLVTAFAPGSKAEQFLRDKIETASHGRATEVLADDSQMRQVLYPMMGEAA